MNKKLKIELLPHTPFLKEDGTFDKEKALLYSAKLAGECYSTEGYSKLKNEEDDASLRRLNFTLALEHSTPYEHINIGFEISNVSKMLAMVLNNERQCSTSEKSARYTNIEKLISDLEANLYTKWLDIFAKEIKEQYGYIHDDIKIRKLAQENARYLASVFTPMQMIYTVPWVQLNRIVSFMEKYIVNAKDTYFDKKLCEDFKEFISECERLNLIDERGKSNRKDRSLSIFASRKVEDSFSETYSTSYLGTPAHFGQCMRHRTIEYSMMFLEEKRYFVPPFLEKKPKLVKEWLNDMEKVSHLVPQGELILINEKGSLDKLILKAKERLCSAAQLEVADQTKITIDKALEAYKEEDEILYNELLPYTKGARCTFPDYKCAKSCKFKEGIQLTRKV